MLRQWFKKSLGVMIPPHLVFRPLEKSAERKIIIDFRNILTLCEPQLLSEAEIQHAFFYEEETGMRLCFAGFKVEKASDNLGG